jgi:hypothetical protein
MSRNPKAFNNAHLLAHLTSHHTASQSVRHNAQPSIRHSVMTPTLQHNAANTKTVNA